MCISKATNTQKQEVINMEDKEDIKFTTTNAGLKIYGQLWDKYNLSPTFNSVAPKHSGAPTSNVMQNLFFRNFMDANSMTALAEKDKEEYFLTKNAKLDRTTYGRNLKNLNDKQRKKILLRFNDKLISKKDIDKHSIMIYDPTAVKAEGKTYEGTDWVYDSCEDKMIKGYALNKLMVKTKKKITVPSFSVNKERNMIGMFNDCRHLYGINKVVIDADTKFGGMDFYKKLDTGDFLFYTKAIKTWKFNYGFDMNISKLRKKVMYLLKRNRILSRTVYKDDMKLRLVFVLGDKRVILTNDFKSNPLEVYNYYVYRWEIETSFKEEKQNLGLNILPARKLEGIKTHFLLCILAYILSQFIVSKVKIADGIKLIKRRIVKVFAVVVEKRAGIELEFDVRYRFRYLFGLEFG